ncbi:MAG: hypothetical protein WD740_01070 [Anaerolineales bacterium]
MQVTTVKVPGRVARPHPHTPQASQSAALDNLQAAIIRLASQPSVRPGSSAQRDLGVLVEQALSAYREYMKTV